MLVNSTLSQLKLENNFETTSNPKNDITTTRIVESSDPEIGDNEIIVSIENFAFTTNNVTYAVAGDTIGYWQFFKTTKDPENDWGSVPVWGFARVIESNLKEISIGERLFGYFPPSDRLQLNPIKITDQGFTDGKDHRKELPAVYNNYVRLSGTLIMMMLLTILGLYYSRCT